MKDQPLSERPRERLVAKGADFLSPAELVAILLRTGLKGANALDVGKQLVAKYHRRCRPWRGRRWRICRRLRELDGIRP